MAKRKKKGGGLVLAKASVSEIVGMTIHYGVVLDFDGFVRAVDLVEGIEVEVERTFDDYKYPIPGKENAVPESERYQHLHFDSGEQSMDGKTALRFARSRYAEGEEGSDFARSKRQQKVLIAFKDKLFAKETLLSPARIKELLNIFSDYIDMDIKTDEYAEFIKLLKIVNKGGITNETLDADRKNEKGEITHEGLLMNPLVSEEYLNQWVLVPKAKDWIQIHGYLEGLLEK